MAAQQRQQDRSSSGNQANNDKPKFARAPQTSSDFLRSMEQANRDFEAELKRKRNEAAQQERARRKLLFDLKRGYTDEEKDLTALVAKAQGLIVPELRRREDEMEGYPYDVLNKAKSATPEHYHVYVILMSRLCLTESYGYATGEPDMPCVYVGQSWHDPEHRFAQHKGLIEGHHSRYVRRWGLALLPEVYEPFNPMPAYLSEPTETALAEALYSMGCTIFGGH
jgi:hypothetical protein